MPTKEPIGPHSNKAKLVKLKIVASEAFADGMLAEQFAQFGYSPEWRKGEQREIPKWLLDRCIQSGGEFELVDG